MRAEPSIWKRPSALSHSLALALVLAGQVAVAGDAIDRSVDAYVREEMAQRRIPGLALAVLRHGHVQKVSAYGYANPDSKTPVTATTLFNIASMTKEVTAVGAMKLVEAGLLRLDDPVGKYLDDLPLSWREVRIRQLLNHTSGLPDIMVDQYTTDTIAESPGEALQLLRDKPMDFAPGSQYRYNGTNYMLLGLLIEKLSGQTYVEFCKTRLFAPLNLSRPTFGDVQTPIKHRATIYTLFHFGEDPPTVMDHIEPLNWKMASIVYPAGGLNISVADFARWLVGLTRGKLISHASLRVLWTPAILNDGSTFEEPPGTLWRNYALGWLLIPDAQHPAVGGTGGVRTAFMMYPKDELVVIVLTNLQGAQPDSLVQSIARRYLARSDAEHLAADGNKP